MCFKLQAKRFAAAVLVFGLLLLVLLFPKSSLAAVGISKSDGQAYTVINTVTLENRSARSIYNINLEVPLASSDSVGWQDTLGEEFSPKPDKITVDEDGRRVGHYTVAELKSGQTLELVQRLAVNNYCVSYDVSSMSVADVSEELGEYLLPTADINSDSAPIKAFAAANCTASANPYLKARLLFAAVNGYMTYDNSPSDSHSAISAYYKKSGNCEDYANLYAALLRAEGIPAKVVSGYLFDRKVLSDNSYLSQSGHINADKMRHTWVMFYINGVGWLVADPTFSYSADSDGVVDWSRFASVTESNRLIYTGDFVANNDRISYDYRGAAPLISYKSELALYSLILPFGDIVNHWAKDCVLSLYYRQPQLVSGVSENSFAPNKELSRAEFVTMINRVLDEVTSQVDMRSDKARSFAYADLRRSHWAYEEIVKATVRGFISGYQDYTIRPNEPITRAEAAAMLSRVIGHADESSALPYDDLANWDWARPAIAKLYYSGLMSGVTPSTFAPQKNMTRAEGAAVIYRWINSDIFRSTYVSD